MRLWLTMEQPSWQQITDQNIKRQIFCVCCYADTQLALQVQQEHTQVVCSDGKPGSARPEGTTAMELGHEGPGIRTHM